MRERRGTSSIRGKGYPKEKKRKVIELNGLIKKEGGIGFFFFCSNGEREGHGSIYVKKERPDPRG